MAEIKLMRLTKWGKDHLVNKGQTACELRVEGDGLEPRGKKLCVDCKKRLLADDSPEAHEWRVKIYGEEGAAKLEKRF